MNSFIIIHLLIHFSCIHQLNPSHQAPRFSVLIESQTFERRFEFENAVKSTMGAQHLFETSALRIGALLLIGICQTNDYLNTQLGDRVHVVHVNHRTWSPSSVG